MSGGGSDWLHVGVEGEEANTEIVTRRLTNYKILRPIDRIWTRVFPVIQRKSFLTLYISV